MRRGLEIAVLVSIVFTAQAIAQSDAPPSPRFLGYTEGDDPPPPRKILQSEGPRPILDLVNLETVESPPDPVIFAKATPPPFPATQETQVVEQLQTPETLLTLAEIPGLPPLIDETAMIKTSPIEQAPLPPFESFQPGNMYSDDLDLPPRLPAPTTTYETMPSQTSSPLHCEECWYRQCDTHRGWYQEGSGEIEPYIDLMYKPGNERSLSVIRGQLPIWQDDVSLIFADLRGRFDDQESSTGNFGIGYRFITESEWIWGIFAYYDLLKTVDRNRFNQFTTSLELMNVEQEFRINAYFPNQGGKPADRLSGISNGTIFTRNYQERAYSGFDFEYGRRILNWGWQDTHEVRWFSGLYHFDNDAPGFSSITGPKSRIEYRCYAIPWLGEQSRFEAGAELTYDRLRDTLVWGFARIRIPLSPRRGQAVLGSLHRRFADVPLRQID